MQALDTNQDGIIDVPDMQDTETEKRLEELDQNDDGQSTREEFDSGAAPSDAPEAPPDSEDDDHGEGESASQEHPSDFDPNEDAAEWSIDRDAEAESGAETPVDGKEVNAVPGSAPSMGGTTDPEAELPDANVIEAYAHEDQLADLGVSTPGREAVTAVALEEAANAAAEAEEPGAATVAAPAEDGEGAQSAQEGRVE